MSRLSQVVVEHIGELMAPINLKETPIKVRPLPTISPRELTLFWRYQGRFPQEFTQAIINKLPQECEFVSYDHLKNQITISGGQ